MAALALVVNVATALAPLVDISPKFALLSVLQTGLAPGANAATKLAPLADTSATLATLKLTALVPFIDSLAIPAQKFSAWATLDHFRNAQTDTSTFVVTLTLNDLARFSRAA